MKVTVFSDFHGKSTTVSTKLTARGYNYLSKRQVNNVRRKICTDPSCTCTLKVEGLDRSPVTQDGCIVVYLPSQIKFW